MSIGDGENEAIGGIFVYLSIQYIIVYLKSHSKY